MKHELNIEKNLTHNFWKVTCPKGDYITKFKDGDDPKDYYGGKELYVPGIISEDDIRNTYRCVTSEEHDSLNKRREDSLDSK